MELQIILSSIAGVAGIAGAISAIAAVALRMRAEREYLGLLEMQSTSVREAHNRAMRDGVVTADELRTLIACLERAAEGMPEARRRLISHGLRQRSMRGRARYAAKLMKEVGIGSGCLPIPTP